jgi:DNA polymerase elongation subunit (family B)
MIYKDADLVIANLIKEAVESEGCRLADVDIDGLMVKVEGSDSIVGNCAKAVEEILD